jgi:hypothetical protein
MTMLERDVQCSSSFERARTGGYLMKGRRMSSAEHKPERAPDDA